MSNNLVAQWVQTSRIKLASCRKAQWCRSEMILTHCSSKQYRSRQKIVSSALVQRKSVIFELNFAETANFTANLTVTKFLSISTMQYVVSICFLFQSWWVNSVSDAPSVLLLNSELILVAGGTMATVRVDPPALSDSGDYNQWKNKVVMWRELTLLDKEKQAFSIIFALSGKDEQIALEMDHNQLKQDDGVDKLIEELDKFFAKNETDLSYAAHKDFDQFVRTSEMKMSEYVSSFEQKYNKAKKHKVEMSDSVLAFKLLDNAFLDNTKKQMVLTACPAIKFDDMKSALNRIFNGEQSNSSEGDVAMKEEVLYTSSRFKSRGFPPRRGGGSRNRGSFGRGRAVVPRGSLRPQTGLTKNPVFHGEISRCNICESVYHYAINCRHRQQEANLTANTDEEGEQDVETVDLVLVNGSEVPAEIFTTEAMKLAILDTACTRTVCGKPWLDNFLQDLTLDQKSQIVFEQSNEPFRFGDAPVVCSTEKVRIPLEIGHKNCILKAEVVDRNIPLLLSKETLKKAQTKIDMATDQITMFGKSVESHQTSNGHYAIPLALRKDLCTPNIVLWTTCNMTSLTDSKLKATLKKLHLQFAHASADKLFQLIKDSARRRPLDSRVKKFLQQICKDCETCIGFTKTKPKPAVGFSLARSFNEVIALDLHELDKSTNYLHIIDVFTRYSSGAIITSKSADVIIKVFLERWVSVFGPPRVGVCTDNGGEFNNEKFREMGELFNFTVKTTAGYSPWSNGVVERGNAVLTNMLQKLHVDQRLPFGVALPWALMAKNSLSNTSGFSPFQLVFGQNPKMPSVLVNEQPALNPKSKCDYLQKHIYALQVARQSFIAEESSEKISRALRADTTDG